MFVQVDVANVGTEPVQDVTLRVAFPRELVPDPVIANPPAPVRLDASTNRLQSEPIGVIRPRETLTFRVPVSVRTTGNVTVWARLESPEIAVPIEQESEAIEIRPQSF